MHSANRRGHHIVTLSLIGWAYTQNDHWVSLTFQKVLWCISIWLIFFIQIVTNHLHLNHGCCKRSDDSLGLISSKCDKWNFINSLKIRNLKFMIWNMNILELLPTFYVSSDFPNILMVFNLYFSTANLLLDIPYFIILLYYLANI